MPRRRFPKPPCFLTPPLPFPLLDVLGCLIPDGKKEKISINKTWTVQNSWTSEIKKEKEKEKEKKSFVPHASKPKTSITAVANLAYVVRQQTPWLPRPRPRSDPVYKRKRHAWHPHQDPFRMAQLWPRP